MCLLIYVDISHKSLEYILKGRNSVCNKDLLRRPESMLY